MASAMTAKRVARAGTFLTKCSPSSHSRHTPTQACAGVTTDVGAVPAPSRVIVGAAIRAISRPEAKKETLSTSTTPDRPTSTSNAPPTVGPIKLMILPLTLLSALAAVSCRASTRRGIRALLAGSKNLDTDDSTKATR